MCRMVCNGECANGAFGATDVVYAVGAGVWWLARNVAAPTALVSAVAVWRWFTGAPLFGAGHPWPLPRRLARIRWWAWPRWQRAVIRTVLTSVAILAVAWPAVTFVVLAVAVVGGGVGTAVLVRRRCTVVDGAAVPVGASEPHPVLAAAPIRVASVLGATSAAVERR